MQEVAKALAPGMVPDDPNDCRPLCPLAPGPVAGAGCVGVWYAAGPECLPKCGPHGTADASQVACAAPALAGVVRRGTGESRAVSDPGRRDSLLCATAALGVDVVAARHPGVGVGGHGPWRAGGSPGEQRAVSQGGDPGGLAYPAGQPARRLDARAPDAADPAPARCARDHDGAVAGRPRLVESSPVATESAGRGAPDGAAPGDHDLSAPGPGAPPGPGLGCTRGPGLGRSRTGLQSRGETPGGDAAGGVGRGAGDALGVADRSASPAGWRRLVWPADVERVGLPGAPRRRLAVAAHPTAAPHPRGPALAGAGSCHALGAGIWHTGGRCRAAGRAPSAPGAPAGAAGGTGAAAGQCLSSGAAVAAADHGAGVSLAAALVGSRALAQAASQSDYYLPCRPLKEKVSIPPHVRGQGIKVGGPRRQDP